MRLSTKRVLLNAATGAAIVFTAAVIFLPAAALSGTAKPVAATPTTLDLLPPSFCRPDSSKDLQT